MMNEERRNAIAAAMMNNQPQPAQQPYSTVGADNGLFAPALIRGNQPQEDAVTAWNNAHRQYAPAPDAAGTTTTPAASAGGGGGGGGGGGPYGYIGTPDYASTYGALMSAGTGRDYSSGNMVDPVAPWNPSMGYSGGGNVNVPMQSMIGRQGTGINSGSVTDSGSPVGLTGNSFTGHAPDGTPYYQQRYSS